jgi:hypothetical protein
MSSVVFVPAWEHWFLQGRATDPPRLVAVGGTWAAIPADACRVAVTLPIGLLASSPFPTAWAGEPHGLLHCGTETTNSMREPLTWCSRIKNCLLYVNMEIPSITHGLEKPAGTGNSPRLVPFGVAPSRKAGNKARVVSGSHMALDVPPTSRFSHALARPC